MRSERQLQLFLRPQKIEILKSKELTSIGQILDRLPGMRELYALVLKDLGGSSTGAEGLSAEQVVRLGVLRLRLQCSYRELSHLTGDSIAVRAFLNLAPGRDVSKSTIQNNLKRIPESTWELLNEKVKSFALQHGIEDGKVVRGDTTTTETNIHFPTDSSLLCDGVRVLTRTMNRVKELTSAPIKSSDHHKRAKKKLYKINNSKNERARHEHSLELIRVTRTTLGYAEAALKVLESYSAPSDEELLAIMTAQGELKRYIPLVKQVISQAHRRIVKGENLLPSEKIVSIFEPDTDIIAKGKRKVVFGHKVMLTTGKSSLILKLDVLKGNPGDKTLVNGVLSDQKESYGYAPDDLAFDGGFASTANRDLAKKEGVQNITFSKNLNMPLETLVSSKKKHQSLMRFRAGVEGCISWLKRSFNMSRILDRSLKTFHSVAQCAAVAYNLTLLARILLRQETA